MGRLDFESGARGGDTIAPVAAINDNGRLVIRFQAGSDAMREADIDIAYAAIFDGLGLKAEERG